MEDSGKIGIGFSGIIQRADRNFKDQIKETNDKLKRYCECNGFVYVDDDNINEKSLNKSLLHLNKAGNKLLSKNLLDCLKNLLFLNTHMHTLDAITDLSTNFDITNNSLKTLRLNNPKNVIFSYLNINSIRNKMGSLREVVMENVDILAIAETKIDESFPTAQFLLVGYHSPYRLDKSPKSGGILVYVKSSILVSNIYI